MKSASFEERLRRPARSPGSGSGAPSPRARASCRRPSRSGSSPTPRKQRADGFLHGALGGHRAFSKGREHTPVVGVTAVDLRLTGPSGIMLSIQPLRQPGAHASPRPRGPLPGACRARAARNRGRLLAVLKALEIQKTLGAEPVLAALRRFPAAARAVSPTSRTTSHPQLLRGAAGPRLRAALHAPARGLRRARAAGRDTVVVTPTASGKTLCYNLPVLDRILKDPDARALYLFPTKALAQDQLAELYARDRGAGRRHRHLHLRRRHAAGRAQGHPRPRPHRGHEPRHAAQGHPARTTPSG